MAKRKRNLTEDEFPGDVGSRLELAVHEGGHIVVSAVLGFPVCGRIWQVRNQIYYQGAASHLTFNGMAPAEIGIAGAVAVAMHEAIKSDGRCQSATIVNTVMGQLADRTDYHLSVSDRRMIAASKDEVRQAAIKAYRILRRYWRFAAWSAQMLFCNEQLTHPEVEAYLRRYRVKVTPHREAKGYVKIRREMLEEGHYWPGMRPTVFNGIPSYSQLINRALDTMKQELRRLKKLRQLERSR